MFTRLHITRVTKQEHFMNSDIPTNEAQLIIELHQSYYFDFITSHTI